MPFFNVFQSHPDFPTLVRVYAVLVLAAQVPLSLWDLYGESRFGWNARSIGFFLSLYGLLVAGVQFILMASLIRWIGERSCLVVGTVANAFGFAALSGTSRGWTAFVLLPLWCLGAIAFPALQSMLSRAVPDKAQGQLQGSLASLGNVISVPIPILATLLLTHSPPGLPGLVWLITAVIHLAGLSMLPRGGLPCARLSSVRQVCTLPAAATKPWRWPTPQPRGSPNHVQPPRGD